MKYIFYFNNIEEQSSGEEDCFYVLTSTTYEEAVKEALALVEDMNINKDDEIFIAEIKSVAYLGYKISVTELNNAKLDTTKNNNGKKSKSNK